MAPTLKQLDYAILQQCMHCGMCLPTCPTYDATRRERSSPRGRIALMRAVADGELAITGTFADEMSYCLGCLACQTACPAGVDYAHLIETARAEVVARRPATLAARFWRAVTMRGLFLRPRLLRLAGRALRLWQRSGLQSASRRTGLVRLLPRDLRRLEPQAPLIVHRFSHELIRPVERPAGETRHRVALLTGCVQDLVFSAVNRDTADVLLANGCEVRTPPVQPCCGSLHVHNGETESARILARRMIDLFPPEQLDAIISNAGGCGNHLRHYGKLLADDPAYAERARLWDTKLRDIHEWLMQSGCRAPRAGLGPMTVTYHDSCHLAHGQKVVRQPRDLLRLIPGLRLVELPEAGWCCGSAGIYNITQPGQSDLLLTRKVGHIMATGASVLATSNPGCHLQIERGLRAAGSTVELLQPVTLLARAYRAEERAAGQRAPSLAALAALVVAGLVSGCQSAYPQVTREFDEALARGRFAEAAAVADERLAGAGEDRLVWALESAYARRLAGETAASVRTFEQAEEILREIDASPEVSISREGLATFSNPYQLTYRGRNLDRILASTYQALACIEMGEVEKARVPMSRTRFRLDDAKRLAAARTAVARRESAEIGDEDRQFQERLRSEELAQAEAGVRARFNGLPTYANAMNPFAAWMHGIYFLHTAEGPADLETARKSLQAAAALTSDNAFILEDLALAGNGTGRPVPADGKTIVYVILESGLAPRWSEKAVTLPLIYGDPRAPIVRIALPQLTPVDLRTAPLRIVARDGTAIRPALLASIDSIVHDEFREEYPGARNRAIASATLKATAAYLANRAAEQDAQRRPRSTAAQTTQIAALLLTNIYAVGSAQADLRNWSSLPKAIHAGRGLVPSGSRLTLSGGGIAGNATCDLPKARAVIVTIRSIGKDAPAVVRASILQP